MKVEIAIEAVLVSVLAAYAVHLARETKALNSQAIAQQGIVVANKTIPFQSVAGIDVSGRLVNKVISPGTKRFVVFGLRGSTLQQDLNFWSSATDLLPRDGSIRLLGFCDGAACADAVRRLYESLKFPVIAYGEANGSQAVVNADAEGNCILLSGRLATLGTIQWRRPGAAPSAMVRLVSP